MSHPIAHRLRALRPHLTGQVMLAVVAMLMTASPAIAANGFSVTPMRFTDLTISQGQSKTVSITIMNGFDSKSTFRLATEDIKGSASNPSLNPILLGQQVDGPISAADWIKPERSSFEIAKGDSREVNVTVSVPSDATGGHYAALTVSSPQQTLPGRTVVAQSRIAVLFFINAGSKPPPEIVVQEVITREDGETIIDYVNKGNGAATDTVAQIEYVNPVTGSVMAVRKSSKCGIALPGSVARCRIPRQQSKGLTSPIARPKVTLTSDGRMARAEQPVEWAGPGSSLLLPLAGLVLLVFWFRRGRRSDEDDDLESPIV